MVMQFGKDNGMTTNVNIERPVKPVVLIAEDDPDQSDMLREILLDEGYAVETAFSGDVAIRKMLRQPYALVILDIRMPGIDGTQVLRQFRRENPNAPVVIVSAFATQADMERYKSYGANASLAKPYDIDELLDLLAKWAPVQHERSAP